MSKNKVETAVNATNENAEEALDTAREALDTAQEALDIANTANKVASDATNVTPDAIKPAPDEVDRPWELMYKKSELVHPLTRKFVTITAEALDADPSLLNYMLTRHPDAFKRLPPIQEEKSEDSSI